MRFIISLLLPLLFLASASIGRAEEHPGFSLWTDATETPERWWQHTRALASPAPMLSLVIGAESALIAHSQWDEDVARHTEEAGEQLPSGLSDVLEVAGHPGIHLSLAALLYGTSLYSENSDMHSLALDLGDALMIGSATGFGLKLAFDTTRPNGEARGFPSGHTGSSFAVATVLQQHFGVTVGLPSFALAGLVAYQRIDTRKHDLSDVLFGAAHGIAVGLMTTADPDDRADLRLVPFTDPVEGHRGVALEWHW